MQHIYVFKATFYKKTKPENAKITGITISRAKKFILSHFSKLCHQKFK
jgi:hypothetical protein